MKPAQYSGGASRSRGLALSRKRRSIASWARRGGPKGRRPDQFQRAQPAAAIVEGLRVAHKETVRAQVQHPRTRRLRQGLLAVTLAPQRPDMPVPPAPQQWSHRVGLADKA